MLLLLSGTTTYGTQAAADFVCSEEHIADLLKRLGTKRGPFSAAREPNLQRRETSVLAASSSPAQEGEKPKLGMHGREESESAPNLEYSTDEGAERGKAGRRVRDIKVESQAARRDSQ